MTDTHTNAIKLKRELHDGTDLLPEQVTLVMEIAHVGRWSVDPAILAQDIDTHWLTPDQLTALRALSGQQFSHAWQFHQALAETSESWRSRPPATVNKVWNKELKQKLSYLDRLFRVDETGDADGNPEGRTETQSKESP